MIYLKKSMIFIVLLCSSFTVKGILAESTTNYTVRVHSSFEEDVMITSSSTVTKGSTLSIKGQISETPGYEFAYYVIDDFVNETLRVDYTFPVYQDMDITIYFTSADQNLALFRDNDGQFLEAQYLDPEDLADDSDITFPTKEAVTLSEEKWDKVLSNISENTIFTLVYDLDSGIPYDYVIGEDDNQLHDEIMVTAPLLHKDKHFSHFEENGQIISREHTVTIDLFQDRHIVAIYSGQEISDAPFISLNNDYEEREGQSTFTGNFYIPLDYTLVEYGMITSSDEIFDLDTEGIMKHDFLLSSSATKDYEKELDQSLYNYVRSYLKVTGPDSKEMVFYSDTLACGDIVVDSLYYETGFEDDSKTSYKLGIVTTNGKEFILNDALIGTIPNDQKMDYKSVRLRNGQIESNFAVPNLSKVSFHQGTYGADDDSYFDLEISLDQDTWFTVDADISTDSNFEDLYEFSLTESIYHSLLLSSDEDYYVRIQHAPSDERVNIDNVRFYSGIVSSDADPSSPFSKQSRPLDLQVSNTLDLQYEVGDSLPFTCQADDFLLGMKDCQMSGYNMYIPGLYTVVFSASDFEGIIHQSSVQIEVLEAEKEMSLDDYLAIDYTGYYDGIEGLYGQDLLLALRSIIQNGFIAQSYDDARQALGYIDEDIENEGNVLLIYNRASVDSTWDSGATWNREHVWPNSRLGVDRVDGNDRSIASDLHNLRACDSGVNSARNNDIYTDNSDGTWFPGEEDKGDVARILFYMVTMYPGLSLENEDTSKNVDGLGYTAEGAVMGDLEDLLAWNLEDLTDPFEARRNDRIEEYQNNRNPFIDYPYLALLIWDYQEIN